MRSSNPLSVRSEGFFSRVMISAMLIAGACSLLQMGSQAYGADASIEAADVNGAEAQAANRQRGDSLLDTAAVQNKRREYGLTAATLAECRLLSASLTDAQLGRLDRLASEAETGAVNQAKAGELIAAGESALEAQQYGLAQQCFNEANSLRRYLDADTAEALRGHLTAVKKGQAAEKKEMKALFKSSAKLYRQGELDQAEAGFQSISDSGVALGFFDRGGDLTSVAGYLAKIAKDRAALALAAEEETVVVEAEEDVMVVEPVEATDDEQQVVTSADVVVSDYPDDTEVIVVESADVGTGEVVVVEAEDDVIVVVSDDAAVEADEVEVITVTEPEPEPSAAPQPAATPAATSAPAAEKKKSLVDVIWPFGSKEREPLTEDQLAQLERLLAQGELALSKGKYSQAEQFYGEALALDPENAEAEEGLTVARFQAERAVSPEPTATSSILTRMKEREQVQVQFIETSLVSAQENVDRLMAAAQFDAARAEASQVLATIEGSKQLLGPQRYQQMREQANGMLRLVAERQEAYAAEQLAGRIEEAERREAERQGKVERARQAKISQLFAQAQAFKEERQYDQAVASLEKLLELDPQNDSATALLEHMQDMQFLVRQDRNISRADMEEQKVFADAIASAIPWAEHMTFGDDWVALTERRRAAVAQREYTGPPAKKATLEKLDRILVDLDYVDAEFQQVLNDLRMATDLNIFAAWGDLEQAAILPDDLVTVKLVQVPAATALDRVLAYVSGGKYDRAGYVVGDDGIISVNAVTILGETYAHYQKVYYVGDLLGARSEAGGGFLDTSGGGGGSSRGGGGSSRGGSSSSRGGSSSRSSGGSSRSSGGSSRGSSSRSGSSSRGSSSRSGGSSRGGSSRGGSSRGGSSRGGRGSGGSSDIYERMDILMELMETTIMPHSWEGYTDEAGIEGRGTVDVYTNNLVVFQTREAHARIGELLSELRRTLGEQVSIEARFLVINSNFLEDIGLDVDFYINLANAGWDQTGETDPITGRQVLEQRENPGPWNRTTPVTARQDSYSFTTPGATTVPGSLGGGATPSAFLVSGSFLDNVQVDFLMRATQANQRSRSLVAPHVTVMNGEEATVFFGVEQPYVASLEAETNNRVGLYNPIVEFTGTDVELLISPTISHDKRYVMLNVEVVQNTLLRFETFTFNEAGTGTETTTEDGGTTTTTGSTASTGTIQEPITEINTVQTHVSVPDGGTLLLGGQKQVGEIEKEMGVPGLSKLPILNRLFTNRSTVKDESVLLILIKPHIILNQEEENLRFGSLTASTDY